MTLDQEAQTAVQFLSTLQPGQIQAELFYEFARLSVMPIYEVVPVRRNANNQVEILVLERPADDPVWAGMVHTPGTVIRADDQVGSFTSAMERIKVELGGIDFAVDPIFVDTIFHQVKRGRELALVHWVTLAGESTVGRWVLSDQLPDNIVSSQRDFIAAAVQNFSQHS